MGISKRLVGDMSSLGDHVTGKHSHLVILWTVCTLHLQHLVNAMLISGWQAPEQLLHGRQTCAVDLFSLGCVLFFCITGGRHPFGDSLERDINIVKNQMDLSLVEHIPEVVHLISRLLNPDPELSTWIKKEEFILFPIAFEGTNAEPTIPTISVTVELEDRETDSDLLKALESIGQVVLGGKWDEKMEPAFITNLGHYRRYKFDSVRDLLRVIRNKLNHYRELPKQIQVLVGPVPEGYDSYFAIRFPKLFIEVYKVVYRHCMEEECFQRYFKSNID
ncbi:serine/threonine-protein kinase/endoribonuclease IRE1a isoform X1 [Fagus crenata]